MSIDLEDPEVETEEMPAKEMIVLSKDKAKANDELITRLSTEYLVLKCNGADDQGAYDVVDTARKKLVKYRTGLAKQVKDLVKPLKDEIKRIGDSADKYQAKLTVVEDHLKAEVKTVDDELARREQERLEELFDLRKRRWLEATGNPPDFDGFPESYIRGSSEADFEAEVQRLAEKTRKEREETIKRIEAETEATRLRNEEAKRLKDAADKLAADQAAFALQQREAKAALDLQAQQQREAAAKIAADERRLAARVSLGPPALFRDEPDVADKPVAVGPPNPPGDTGDATAARPSEPPPWTAEQSQSANDDLNAEVAVHKANHDYDRGYVDGLTWGMRYSKSVPTAIAALVANRKNTEGYRP